MLGDVRLSGKAVGLEYEMLRRTIIGLERRVPTRLVFRLAPGVKQTL